VTASGKDALDTGSLDVAADDGVASRYFDHYWLPLLKEYRSVTGL